MSISETNAQSFILKPVELQADNGSYSVKLLMKTDQNFRVSWSQFDQSDLNLSGSSSKLILGRISNKYDVLELDVSGTSSVFIPDDIGLTPGRYYARVTNSTARTTAAIADDFSSNPTSIVYSNEIFIIVEANEAPSIIAPRGTIDNPSPTFQWTAVAGVPNYWLILSSTPFEIVEDDNGEISIEGASIVWQYMTKNTTANYGDINLDSPFTDEALPLNSGQEYSYTVLNVYEDNNPAFTSPVFGGIVPFIYQDPDAVPATNLVNPPDGSSFIAEETITFEWEDVPEASNYTVVLSQLVRQQGIDVSIPIWGSTTTNTIIEYPAIENLKNGLYEWNVISNNSSGGGTTSGNFSFNYSIPTGEFNASIRESSDNSVLVGVTLTVRSISGGVTPSLPYFVQESSYADSLVEGTYEFLAEKDGYESNSVESSIIDQQRTNLTISLTALPSSISGRVVDGNGDAIDASNIIVTSLDGEFTDNTSSDSDGNFVFSLGEGTYELTVSKSGFISPDDITVTVGLNEQVVLDESLVMVNDEASVSGFIFNDDGDALQRARVNITNGSDTYEAFSSGTGSYSFTVSSGAWTISTTKTGFVPPDDIEISLSTGDVLQNQDFVLKGNANQVTGFIRERITNEDGSIGTASFEGVEVKAIPTVGDVVTATSTRGGQYVLSLKNGSYTIQANQVNYSPDTEQDLVLGVGETVSGIDFVMIPNPSSISGTVLLPDGNGVNEATVEVAGVGNTLTSSSGYYSISVPEGEQTVSVVKNGLVSPDPKVITVSVGQDLTGVDFQMIPNAGTVSGNVSSGGEALSNTLLIATNNNDGSTSEITNNLDGSYTFNLSSGNWYIKATKSGFISDSTEVLTIGPGQQVVNPNLSLVENLTTIRGIITSDGSALRSTSITVTKPEDPTFETNTINQVNGTYAITLPAGDRYSIRASKDGYRTVNESTEPLTAGETVTIDFALNANPSSVAGIVTLNGSSVLSDVIVVALNSDGIPIDSVTTDSDGEYLLGLDPGDYTIRAKKPGHSIAEANTILNIGQNITGVNLSVDENFAFISGSIVNNNGNPVEQVFVNLQKTNGIGASTVTDQNGNFSLTRLTTGDFSIELSKTGFISINESFELTDGDFLEYNKTLIAKSGSISGLVADENGIVLEGATVTATNTEGIEYVSITNASGLYTINSVEPSSYEVNASLIGYTTDDASNALVTIDELNAIDIDITNLIPNNGVIQGTITNVVTGDPIKDVQVSANGTRGSGFAVTGANGQFEITNLIPSTYNLISLLDGFRSDTLSIEIDPLTPTFIANRTLLQNSGTLSGVVTDLDNQPLPFLVSISASSEDNTLTTQTNTNGEFKFEDIETGETYTVETDIFREGYVNTSKEVSIPLGADDTIVQDGLDVEVTQGIISGNAGINGASILLIDDVSRELIELVNSNSNNEYSIDFLAAGAYRVIPSRSGFIFNPDTSGVINVTSTGTVSQNFTAQANIGNINVTVRNSASEPLSNVDVNIVSSDTTVISSVKTDGEGNASFLEIKAGLDYFVRASREGFTSIPEVDTVSLNSGGNVNSTFEMLENSSSISGLVKLDDNGTLSNLNNVSVNATLEFTGQKFESTTNNEGAFTFDNLASGSYSIIARRSGFTRDTVEVTLSAGSTVNTEDLILERASVLVSGNVLYKGVGVQGLEVQVTGASTRTLTTNSSGRFRANFEVSTVDKDTTIYQFQITNGPFSKSYLREFTKQDIGRQFRLPNTNLPSGQINLLVTDGVQPLEGAILQFGISGGESDQIVTGANGSFSSDENLRQAAYVVSVSKEGLLLPLNMVRYDLPSDTTVLDTTLALPYRQLSVNEIFADRSTLVSVVNPSGYDNTQSSGVLFYKTATKTLFNSVDMTLNGDTLSAEIPALFNTEEVTFYSRIIDEIAGNTFVSSESTIEPLASGILTNIRISPTLSGLTLRAGEIYDLELLVRDGVNETLEEDFSDGGDGSVTWENLSDSTGLEITQISGTEIRLTVLKSGNYTLKATATLDGSNVSVSSNFTASDIPLRNIFVSAPSKQLSNSSSHVFSYAAFDTSGNSVLLGQSLNWSIDPPVFGSINNQGQFTPVNSSVLGAFRIIVSDEVTGIAGFSENVELVASIRPEESYVFNNGEGFELNLQVGSVDFPSQISLTETNPPPSKKFVFAQGSDQSYTVGDRIYVLAFSGSSLKNTAQLIIPTDSTISELNSGEREVARFNFTTLQWEVFESLTTKSLSSPVVGTIETEQLGQFAVLAQNTPLGISNAAVLPSPFSPDIAPVKIGYWLDTTFPPAKVTIRIFNIRGELVRTLLEDDLQQPGRYGSSSSTKEITWDGLTNTGNMARNGRYVVQITAEDTQTEEVKLLQVILIK
jgi:hypothetical protein